MRGNEEEKIRDAYGWDHYGDIRDESSDNCRDLKDILGYHHQDLLIGWKGKCCKGNE